MTRQEIKEKQTHEILKKQFDQWREVLSTAAGRAVALQIITLAGVYGFTEDFDHLEFAAGKRDIGLRVLQVMENASPDALALARKEYNEYMSALNKELETAEDK